MKEKNLIKQILLCFEQSSTKMKYAKIYEWDDGPNQIKQITLSFGITEFGNLKRLIQSYVYASGIYSEFFKPYIDKIGRISLVGDSEFKFKLKESGKDPVMQQCQEKAFDELYIDPAYDWCDKNKLTLPLSKLVICDSFLQSGSILSFLRNRFSEKVPVNGGSEKKWVDQYCRTRRSWLESHSNPILRNTVYRMDFMIDRMEKNDWYLEQFPFNANGNIISK